MLELIVPLTDKAAAEKFNRYFGTNGELVRCRDCKHWVCADTVGSVRYGDCTNGHSIISRHAMPNENYYCADGERRDEDATD